MATGVRCVLGDFSANFFILSARSRAFAAFAFHCCFDLSDWVVDLLRWRKDSAALM